MSETAADEQDLAKALDSVANAAGGFDSSSTTTTVVDGGSGAALPPVSPISPSVQSPPPIDASFTTPITVPVESTPPNSFSTPLLSPVSNDVSDVNNSDSSVPPLSVPVVSNDDSSNNDNSTSSPALSPDTVVTGPLADIKNEALNELRPLVDKLNVSPEEKFDTLLLLIRSTDDSELIAPAHEAAKGITDETRRAEALLDIIKEIDYLSRQDKSAN